VSANCFGSQHVLECQRIVLEEAECQRIVLEEAECHALDVDAVDATATA